MLLREELFHQFGEPKTDDFEIRGQITGFELTMIWNMRGIYSVKVMGCCG